MKYDRTMGNWVASILDKNDHFISSKMFRQSKTSGFASGSHWIKGSDGRFFHFGHWFWPDVVGLSRREDCLLQISTST